MTKTAKDQRRREKSKKLKRRRQSSASSETSFVIKMVNGIEVAYATRTAEDVVSEKGNQDICRLSEIAIRIGFPLNCSVDLYSAVSIPCCS